MIMRKRNSFSNISTAGNRTKIRKLGGIEISMRILSTSGSSSSRSSSGELIVVDMALLELIHSLSWEGSTHPLINI